jgi:hypothetical protein
VWHVPACKFKVCTHTREYLTDNTWEAMSGCYVCSHTLSRGTLPLPARMHVVGSFSFIVFQAQILSIYISFPNYMTHLIISHLLKMVMDFINDIFFVSKYASQPLHTCLYTILSINIFNYI